MKRVSHIFTQIFCNVSDLFEAVRQINKQKHVPAIMAYIIGRDRQEINKYTICSMVKNPIKKIE